MAKHIALQIKDRVFGDLVKTHLSIQIKLPTCLGLSNSLTKVNGAGAGSFMVFDHTRSITVSFRTNWTLAE
jgi:hypothetical protein